MGISHGRTGLYIYTVYMFILILNALIHTAPVKKDSIHFQIEWNVTVLAVFLSSF